VSGQQPVVSALRVKPGDHARLSGRDPADRLDVRDKTDAAARLAGLVARLGVLHNRLWAESQRSVLLILQGMDASGKDGTIRSVLAGISPQGCRVVAFKEPTTTELAHDYLWRVHAACPDRGDLGIFNRSHYEDVVAVRVRQLVSEDVWRPRYDQICAFERMLVEEGTTIVKVFLHVSPDEQRKRLQERLDDPDKRWKFRAADLDDRRLWPEYVAAYEDAITATSTSWAPWHVIPADHKWVRNVAIAELLVDTFERLDPRLPDGGAELDGLRI